MHIGCSLTGDAPMSGATARHAIRMPARWRLPAACAMVAIVLFLCYLRLSQLLPVNSDGASNALQAWDMLHGNVLLHGWTLSDVSFYTTELPQYALVELVAGLGPAVIHLAAAMTYTLIVMGAALLARGRADGAEGWVRMAVAAGVLLAPEPGTGTFVLLLSPDHVGTSVPLLAAFILLDRAPQRWPAATAVVLLLVCAQIGDALATVEGALPIAAVCTVRGYQELAGSGRLERWRRSEAWLGAGALLSAGVARAVLALIRNHGGFYAFGAPSSFSAMSSVSAHFWLALQSVLLLLGADFTGQPLGIPAALALLHLVGVALAGWAAARAARRFFADDDLVAGVLVVSFILTLASFVFGVRAFSILNAREIAGIMPIGAALAGRLLAGPLIRAKLLPALAVVLAGYLAALGYAMGQQPPINSGQRLASWLLAHHLDYGLAGYWQSNAVTLDSGQRVQVRYAGPVHRRLARARWESESSWYNPRQHDARFVIYAPDLAPVPVVRATFGPPTRTYDVGGYKVLVYSHNLLADLRGTFVVPQVRPLAPISTLCGCQKPA